MVAGTGHDFEQRHSCKDGFFIRTSLLKEITFDLTDSKKFGHPDGNVRLGAGIVWSEAHSAAANNSRVVSSGWATTVGVIGWSIGGGHGPMAPALGIGVDNILEVDIVLNDGSLITANSVLNPDLYWALRGGGGSNWGVITSITVKVHKIPTGGFTIWTYNYAGTFCNYSMTSLYSIIDTH